MACVGLVAAQAGSLDFLRLEWTGLAKAADGKPLAAHVATRGSRSYSTASSKHEPPGMFVRASQASDSPPSAAAGGLGASADESPASGETTPDALGLFELSPPARPLTLAASNDPLKFGDRFHGLVDGAGSGSQRPSYGSGSRRAQKGLADCCDDPATQQSDPLLTAPTPADTLDSPIPELGAWTLMILGFSLSGLVLRGERRRWA